MATGGTKAREKTALSGCTLAEINLGASADWPKQTLDIFTANFERRVETADELREALAAMGGNVEAFKTKQAYTLPLNSGNYPWIAEL